MISVPQFGFLLDVCLWWVLISIVSFSGGEKLRFIVDRDRSTCVFSHALS